MFFCRHPFKLLIPHNIVLHETFTVDTERKHYVLETRAVLDENEETVQTLTLGYQPDNPYVSLICVKHYRTASSCSLHKDLTDSLMPLFSQVCAGLVHPYSAAIVPKNTEVCIRTKTDQNVSRYNATFHWKL